MKVGYVRVSTQEQNVDRQIKELSEVGVDKIFVDKASGKDIARPEFQNMLEFLRTRDTLTVSSLDRLGRSYIDVKQILEYLRNKGIF